MYGFEAGSAICSLIESDALDEKDRVRSHDGPATRRADLSKVMARG